jgi:hypothetical protein
MNSKKICDSDYSENPETIISITEFIVYLLDALICWRSKAQRSDTLSSNEADYTAISESGKRSNSSIIFQRVYMLK